MRIGYRRSSGLALVVAGVALLLLASQAMAQNGTTGGAVDAGANYVTVGVIAHITGDDNGDGTADVYYREQGAPSWKQGHSLCRLDATRYAGSIFYLTADTIYEVDVQLSDPDGVSNDPAPFLVSTKSETIPQGSGRQIYVSPTGNDNGAGTEQDPYGTIGKAQSVSVAGDFIHVLPGVYREAVVITRSGSSSAYITYKAEGAGVILDSSDPVFLDATPDWSQDTGNVYWTSYSGTTNYVAADGVRLYPRGTLNSLRGNAGGVDGGFYLDTRKDKLYVSIPNSGGDPDGHTMNVATMDEGIRIQADFIVIDGFEIRYYGTSDYQKGIFIDSASDNVIRNCTIHNCGSAVWIRGTASADNLISNNTIYDTGVTTWPWEAVKDTEMEEAGVFLEAGWGNVVRDNAISGSFDGVGPAVWSYPNDEDYNGATDIYGNEIYDILDDAIEAEGTAINLSVFNNSMSDFHMGISIAPVTKGPAYFFRNSLYQWANTATQQASAIKLSASTAGRVYLYHNTYCTTAASQNGIEPSGNWDNLVSRNNILYASYYAIEDFYDHVTTDWNYDCIYTTYDVPSDPRYVKWENIRYPTLADWQAATGLELNGLAQDPAFTNIGTGDLTLQSGSPCIDRGVVIPGINDGYLGSAPDIGCFEGASAPVPPTANFSGNPTEGYAPLTVAFTDLSSGSPTSWDWTFGDSGTSQAQHPSHEYTAVDSYTVSLTVQNAQGQDTETKPNYITVSDQPDQSCHVGAIDMANGGVPSYKAAATITVHNQACAPLVGVTVAITWTGAAPGTDSGVTNDSGQVTFTSGRNKAGGTFTCTVTNLTKSGYPYESADNHETSDSITLP